MFLLKKKNPGVCHIFLLIRCVFLINEHVYRGLASFAR